MASTSVVKYKWIKNLDGLEAMKKRNEEKAAILYDFLDNSKLFKGTVRKEDRSLMNVPFVTGDKELDAKFGCRSKSGRPGELKRTQNGWRYACFHLQCYAKRGRYCIG